MAIVGESGSGKTSLALAVARLLPSGRRDRRGLGAGRRRRRDGPHRRRSAPGAWAAGRLPRPGLDGGAQPGAARRPPGGRGVRDARRRRARRRPPTGGRAARSGRDPAGGRGRRHVPARALGRHAPAGHDRDGARPALAAPHRRRADDRARRDRAGRDPGPGRGAPGRARRHVPVDHPRHGRGRRDRRHGRASCTAAGSSSRGRRRRCSRSPAHPYTQALLETVRGGAEAPPKAPFATIAGAPPAGFIPPGCPFHPRCAHVHEPCPDIVPVTVDVGPGHRAACHLLGGAR